MNKLLYAISCSCIIGLNSCAGTYNIKGTSNDANLEESKIYLTIMQHDEPKHIDSCEVIHGQFSFAGTVDSVKVAMIGTLPVVLEEGDITVKDDNAQSTVTGTPLNDKLAGFMKKYQQFLSQAAELERRPTQAVLNGDDWDKVQREVYKEQAALNEELFRYISNFITENYDNVLGSWVFLNACAMRFAGIPTLDAWAETILTKAPDTFKNDPEIKMYCDKAQENERIMNGSIEPTMPPAQNINTTQVPTPNQMAQPTDSARR